MITLLLILTTGLSPIEGKLHVNITDTIPAVADTVMTQEENHTALNDTIPDPEEEPVEEEPDTVAKWPEFEFPGFETVATDSTLRWLMDLNRSVDMNRQRGIITYRTGSVGRPFGMDIYSYENRHMKAEMFNLSLNNPVSNQVNWNRLPFHKVRNISEYDRGVFHETQVQLREHYLVQPRTYLNFDESREDYRSLEFAFTQNLTARMNLELSFWDRRDGSRYSRSGMEGNQIVARGRYHFNDKLLLKAGFIGNTLEQEQSFGYVIPDPAGFDFNPFNSTPRESGALSDHKMRDYFVQLHQRKNKEEAASGMFGVHYQVDRWTTRYSQDTTAYAIDEITAFAQQKLRIGNGAIQGRAKISAMRDDEQLSLTEHTWIGWEMETKFELPLAQWISLDGQAGYTGRNDQMAGYSLSGSLRLNPIEHIELQGHAGLSSRIPDLQSLYWNSIEWQGDDELENELNMHLGGQASLKIGSILEIGARGDARRVEQGIFTDAEGNFMNIQPYTNLSGAAWVELDSRRFEADMTVNYQQFQSSDTTNTVNRNLDLGGERIWMKGSLYWKNYLFDRATYVKAGVSGIFSPGNFLSASYLPPLNRWQHGLSTQNLPSYYRMDLDISARVRWMMVLLRWENVLDRVGQSGYFETEGYPMPSRRFMFGLRILFTN